jgi:anti-sigma factor RsiW
MQCREVCDLLDSFLGQELMVETNHELMRHLETCPDCRGELEARRQLRTVLRRAFTNTDALHPRPNFAADGWLTSEPRRQSRARGRASACGVLWRRRRC